MACVSAQQGGGMTSPNCTGTGVCNVDVSVNNCVVTPNPQSLPVPGKNINIFWEMNSSSTAYRFRDADGIELKQYDSDFDQPESQSNGKKFKLHDKNSKARPGEKALLPLQHQGSEAGSGLSGLTAPCTTDHRQRRLIVSRGVSQPRIRRTARRKRARGRTPRPPEAPPGCACARRCDERARNASSPDRGAVR
jgi:hypothetical protein